jgi:uncharacterized membrane protein YhaH (DUF805 family)
MADVFISYAREDHSRAEQVARGLTAMGLECFWDTEIPPGQTWSDYIEGKLDGARAVVVLWSQHSTKSQWVREEARMGRDKSKLIPAVIDGSPPPLGFGEVQAADLTSWRGESNTPQWTRFANAVFTVARGTPPPQEQAAPQPAPSAWRAAATSAPSGDAENLSPIGYVQKCLRLYFDGKGRARRSEYWWWILFTVIVSVVAWIVDAGVSGINPYTSQPNSQVVSIVASLAVLAPSLAVMSRRFHDVGLSGWLVAAVFGAYVVGWAMTAAAMPLGALIVIATALAVLVVALIPSRPGSNQYGPNPKGALAAI